MSSDGTPRPLPDLSDSDVARFWAMVRRRKPRECWPWTGATIDGRGGVFAVYRRESGPRLLRAARVAYLLASGKDPGRKRVCHSCTTERCCNPAHLFLGNQRKFTKAARARSRASAAGRRGR